jgi:ATP/maltotriose-dependent transcriptional regulator MalT
MLGIMLPQDRMPRGGWLAASFESLESSWPAPWLWPPGLHAAQLGGEVAAYRLYSQAVTLLRSAGCIGQLPPALAGLGYSESYLGHWSNAVVHASEGVRLARETGQPPAAGACLGMLARISGARGRANDCHRYSTAAREAVSAQGADAVVAVTKWGFGQLAIGAGRYQEAYQHLSAIAEPERWPDGSLFAAIAVLDLLEAAVLTDRLEVASDVLAALERWARPYSPPWARLTIHRTRALLAASADAEAEFEAALAVTGAELRRFEFARTQLLYGEWLRRQRRKTEARAQLRSTLALFVELGARQWSERARVELRATGESIRRHDPTAIDQLTPQELQIARLAACGLSNREIGAQLFLSPRTVGFHLYNVFPKLGVASRGELRHLKLEEPSVSA